MVRVGHQEPRVEADVGGGGVLRGEGGWKSAEGELEQESSGRGGAGGARWSPAHVCENRGAVPGLSPAQFLAQVTSGSEYQSGHLVSSELPLYPLGVVAIHTPRPRAQNRAFTFPVVRAPIEEVGNARCYLHKH